MAQSQASLSLAALVERAKPFYGQRRQGNLMARKSKGKSEREEGGKAKWEARLINKGGELRNRFQNDTTVTVIGSLLIGAYTRKSQAFL